MTTEELRRLKAKLHCFAADENDRNYRCKALERAITEEGCMKCRFRKPSAEVTDGVWYGQGPGPDGMPRHSQQKERKKRVYVRKGELHVWEGKEDGGEEEQPAEPSSSPLLADAGGDRMLCRTCKYGAAGDIQFHRCEYILMTGHRRPCEPGECEAAGVYIRASGKRKTRTEQGKDEEI